MVAPGARSPLRKKRRARTRLEHSRICRSLISPNRLATVAPSVTPRLDATARSVSVVAPARKSRSRLR